MEIKYVKSLEDCNVIEKIASDMGITLPSDFVEFFKVNNGGRPIPNEVTISSGSKKVLNSFLSFNESDKENVIKAKRRVAQDDERLFPFANDPAGNYFCLKGEEVVFYFSEDGEVIGITNTFGDFIKKLK